MLYPAHCLRDWRRNDCRILTSSEASEYLKGIIAIKVKRRPRGRRFFGEAYVATQVRHRHGYYGSFKWLTNSRFLDDRPFPSGPTKPYQEELRKALLRHFGKGQLERLQKRAHKATRVVGVRPVAPDLWLIDSRGNHRFIEVKLPGDRIHPHQLAGMYLIASCLRTKGRLSVEIIELRPQHGKPPATSLDIRIT